MPVEVVIHEGRGGGGQRPGLLHAGGRGDGEVPRSVVEVQQVGVGNELRAAGRLRVAAAEEVEIAVAIDISQRHHQRGVGVAVELLGDARLGGRFLEDAGSFGPRGVQVEVLQARRHAGAHREEIGEAVAVDVGEGDAPSQLAVEAVPGEAVAQKTLRQRLRVQPRHRRAGDGSDRRNVAVAEHGVGHGRLLGAIENHDASLRIQSGRPSVARREQEQRHHEPLHRCSSRPRSNSASNPAS